MRLRAAGLRNYSILLQIMANFFRKVFPYIASTSGTILAMFIGAPLLIFIITRFTIGGNKSAIPYADTYIKNSDTIVVKVPKDYRDLDRYDDVFTTSGWFMGVAQTRTAVYNLIYFYAPEYNKYVGVVSFKGGYNVVPRGGGEKTWYEDLEVQRWTFITNICSFSAYVNRRQWNDPTYGTKDNPVPIFFKRVLSYPHSLGGMEDFYTIKPDIYKTFVELYLAHGLSSREFNRLYGKDMERLGLD